MDDEDEDVGGESVCYVHYFCEECGVLLDGREHVDNCSHSAHASSAVPTDIAE